MESYFDHILTISIILGIFIITFSKEIIKADNYLGIYARKQEKKLGTSVGLYLGLLLFIAIHSYLISLSLWFIILGILNFVLLIFGLYFNLKVENYKKPNLLVVLISISFPLSLLIYEFLPGEDYIGKNNIIKTAIVLSIVSFIISLFFNWFLSILIAMSIIGFHLTYKLLNDENETIEEFYNIDESVIKYFSVISFPILFIIYIIISGLILYIQNNGQYLKRKT